jgi:hypothetical protein
MRKQVPIKNSHSILEQIRSAHQQYYRLIICAGPSNSGKTLALKEIQCTYHYPLINVSKRISEHPIELFETQKISRLSKILEKIIDETGGDIVLLDNTEILFDPYFKQDPLRTLQKISRSRTIAASWNGNIIQKELIYAEPNHPEYRRYKITHDFLVVDCLRLRSGSDL